MRRTAHKRGSSNHICIGIVHICIKCCITKAHKRRGGSAQCGCSGCGRTTRAVGPSPSPTSRARTEVEQTNAVDKRYSINLWSVAQGETPLESAASVDNESAYTLGVRCFNKKIGLDLASFVEKIWVFKREVKIGCNTLNMSHI